MNDLDGVLKELGQFGRYQILTYVLLFFPLVFTSIGSMTYVFTAGDISYRCLVPECESNQTREFDGDWLDFALPYKSGGATDRCLRYKSTSDLRPTNATCSRESFSKETETCQRLLFQTDENTIVKEFDLLCEKNNWKRTIIGTLNNVAQFIGMPIAGLVSDRYGRKTMLISCTTLSAISGTLRSFSTSYVQFIIFEMLDAMAYAGLYSGIFVFGVEILGPDRRGIGGAIISAFYSIGEVILGLVVWFVHDWRQYLRILYVPGFLFIFYVWILPESIRWVVTQGKRENVTAAIKRICRLNKKTFNDGLMKSIENLCSNGSRESVDDKAPQGAKEEKREHPLKEVLHSRIMLLRVLNCSFCWITHTFVFYGLSLNSVSIAGHKYLNFILVSCVEIPGYILSWMMIDRCGRKLSLCLGLVVSGVACTSFYFVPQDAYITRLTLFLTGKLAITESFTALYVLASEIYPTDMRHSLMSFCSTLGRVGSMVAPQTPLMANFIDPVLMFGGISFVAAALSFYFPETANCKMPDTLKDAENLGKNDESSPRSLEQKDAKGGLPPA